MYPLQRENPLNFGPLRKRRLAYGAGGQPPEEEGQDPNLQDFGQDFQMPDDDDQDNEVGTPVPGDRFSQLFNAAMAIPPGKAESAYAEHLAKGVPKESDFKPGKVNRLAAILGGASEGGLRGAGAGIRTASEILDSPYRKGVAAWKLQSDALAKAAQVESSMMGRKASIARTVATSEAREADRRARVAHWTAQDNVAADRAKRVGFVHRVGEDGHLYFEKPNDDGTVIRLDGGKVGESIPEKTKRELDKFKVEESVRQGNREKNIETQAGNAGVLQNNRLAGERVIAGETQAAITGRQEADPNRQNAASMLRMRESLAKYGEKMTKSGKKFSEYFYIPDTTTGIPTALKAGDPKDPTYQELYEYIYGKKK